MSAKKKLKEMARKLVVKHEPSMKFVKTTSYSGNDKDTKVSFKESGGYHKRAMEGLKDPKWQAHFAEKMARKSQ